MVDSVNPGSVDPSSPPLSGSPEMTTGSTEAPGEISLGFSLDNSISYSPEDSSELPIPDSSVELDPPAASTPNSQSYLQRAFEVRLSGFRAVVADFNARFDADNVDLLDTQTLLMVVKGMVSDTRALLSAESIGFSSGSQAILQQRRLNAAKDQQQLRAEISARYSQMNDANQQIETNSQTLVEKSTSRATKEQAIADATSSGNTALATQLQSELAEIDSAITQLIQNSSTLVDSIYELQAANAASRENLSLARQVIDLASEDFVNVRQLVGRIRERYDGAATKTGEEEVSESKRESRAAEIQLNKNEKRQRELRRNTREVDGDIRTDQATETENQTAEARFGSLPGVINPAHIKALATLFPPEDPVILLQKLRESSGQPSPQELSEVSEALALILQATPPQLEPEPEPEPEVTASEAKPEEQPYLGDNLSLEGADSPQSFALLLLQKNMEVLQENASDQEQLAALELLQTIQIENLISEMDQVETMVAESLEESEKAAAVISRKPV